MSEILRREDRWVRRDLDDTDIARLEVERKRARDDRAEAKETVRAFAAWAKPKIEAAFDRHETDDEGQPALSIGEARALNDELDLRKRIAAGRIAQMKANERRLLDAIANGYEYRRVECEVLADPDKPEVIFVDAATGEEIDRRAMTEAERQQALPGTDGAPRALQ